MNEMSPGQSVELVNSIGPTSQVWPELYKEGSGLYALAATIKDPVVQRAIFAGNIKLQSGTMDTFKKEGDMMNATLHIRHTSMIPLILKILSKRLVVA